MPSKPKVCCTAQGCPRYAKVGDGGLCAVHVKARHKDYSKSRGDSAYTKIYDTKAWKLTRKQALYRDDGWCVICKDAPAVLVDHIEEVKDLTDETKLYDLNNLQSLCVKCHAKKTKMVAKLRET